MAFLLATESDGLVQDLRQALEGLLGSCRLEIVPEEGPIALARLRAERPMLAFLSMHMRMMDGLTLLRALPPGLAGQVVLLVPDTLEGYRVGWEGLSLGAGDFLVTRGNPPQRLKGNVGHRLRRVANLLVSGPVDAGLEPASRPLGTTPGPLTVVQEPPEGSPWVVLAETRHLAFVSEWLRTLPSSSPVIVRIPEGPRLLRVAREEFGRLVAWPVRGLVSGDPLVPGQIHLFTDTETIRVDPIGGRPTVELRAATDPPGTWSAYHEVLARLRSSTAPLRVLLPEAEDREPEAYLLGMEPAADRALEERALLHRRHGVYHFHSHRARAGRSSRRSSGIPVARQRAA